MSTTTNETDIDWHSIKEEMQERADDPMSPVPYSTTTEAIEAVHPDLDVTPGQVIQRGLYNDILVQHGEGLDDAYAFDLDALNADEDEWEPDLTPGEVDLSESPESDETVYPPLMKRRDQWVVWAGNKMPRPPWQGHLFPANWGQDTDPAERPTRPFDVAERWKDKAPGMNLDTPDDEDLELDIGYILPHKGEREAPIVTLLDLDDVRRPDTGEIHPAARDIIERCGSYAEFSTSGEGVHVMVAGDLPESIGKVVEPIDDEPWVGDDIPQVEIYSNGRVVAMTGRHVEGTPTTIADADDVIDDLIDEYMDDGDAPSIEDEMDARYSDTPEYNKSDDNDDSPYYYANPRKLISTSGDEWKNLSSRSRGPHPVHGSSHGDNFDVTDEAWHCLRCDTGGGALHLVAVLEGYLGDSQYCKEADDFSNLSDEEFAEVCMLARDNHSAFDADWKPPYRAVLGLAKALNLHTSSDEALGGTYDMARRMYDNNDVSVLR